LAVVNSKLPMVDLQAFGVSLSIVSHRLRP
jgi:hypothetical protein